jgi:hypothetical protein
MPQDITESTTPPQPSIDGKTGAAVGASKSVRKELQELLNRYPDYVHFILHPPAPLEPADWLRFASLAKLALAQIDFSNPIGLIFVRDFVVSDMELLRMARLKAQIIDNEQLSILRGQIEDGLLSERRPEQEIAVNAALLAKGYFEGAAPWRELTDRFPAVYDRYQLEAAAYRRRLRDLGWIEQMLKSCEQRRDRALNNLYLLRKDDAQRLREATQRLESVQAPKSPIEKEIAVPATN